MIKQGHNRVNLSCFSCYRALIVCVILGMIGMAGCTSTSEDPLLQAEIDQINDPLEPMNRYFFAVNEFLDFFIVHPFSDTYDRVFPTVIKDRVSNFFENIGEVPVFINTLLQARFTDSSITLARFLINTTLGIGGMFDVATELDLPAKDADFGQTLYTYGIGEGPYLFLPILGPSNPRDLVGSIFDRAANPINYVLTFYAPASVEDGFFYGRTIGGGINGRTKVGKQLDDLRRNSLDFYAQLRSVSRQFRRSRLAGGEVQIDGNDPFYEQDDPFYEDIDDSDDSETEAHIDTLP